MYTSCFKVWDECICRADSDGDGKSNGEELGDPECVWKPGQAPARTTDITHPGNSSVKSMTFPL